VIVKLQNAKSYLLSYLPKQGLMKMFQTEVRSQIRCFKTPMWSPCQDVVVFNVKAGGICLAVKLPRQLDVSHCLSMMLGLELAETHLAWIHVHLLKPFQKPQYSMKSRTLTLVNSSCNNYIYDGQEKARKKVG